MPDAPDEMRFVKSVIESWADRQPAEAAKWLRENMPADETRAELLTTVAEHWAAREGAAGLAMAVEEGIAITPRLAAQAAGNFAIDHTLPETTAFLRQFQNDAQYQSALGAAAASAFRGRLDEARNFVMQNRRGNWQVPMVEMLAAWEIDSKATAQSAAQEFLRLNVAPLPVESVQTAANHLAEQIASYDRLPAALDWTLRLPATAAPGVRQTLVAKFKGTPGNCTDRLPLVARESF